MQSVTQIGIQGAMLIEPQCFCDKRGYFYESYNSRDYAELGITCDFVQDNQSYSSYGVLRGMHYQNEPQSKLVRVVRGAVMDAIIDLRESSPTYLKHACVVLSDENKRQLYIPPMCAHGFLVLSDNATFLYKCSDFYKPHQERGIRYDDPTIAIKWPFAPIAVSDKDLALPFLQQ